jgi:hypothetical protein
MLPWRTTKTPTATIQCICPFLGAFAKLGKATITSSRLSVRPHETIRLPIKGIFIESDISVFFKNLSRKFRSRHNLNRKILHEDQYTIMFVFRSVLLRMRNISDTPVQSLRGGNPTTRLPSSRLVNRPRELSVTFKPQCKRQKHGQLDHELCHEDA